MPDVSGIIRGVLMLIATTALGCSESASGGPGPADLALAVDLAPLPDLALPLDLYVPPDFVEVVWLDSPCYPWQIEPPIIDFGRIPVGSTMQRVAMVRYHGTESESVENFGLWGTDVALTTLFNTSGGRLPIAFHPDDSYAVTIEVSAPHAGNFTAVLDWDFTHCRMGVWISWSA